MCDIVSLFINTIVLNLLTVLVKRISMMAISVTFENIFISYAFKLVHIAEYSVWIFSLCEKTEKNLNYYVKKSN